MNNNPVSVPRTRQEVEPRPTLRDPRVIEVATLGTSSAEIVAALVDRDFALEHFWISNVTGSAATVDLYMVPDGGSASAANAIAVGLNVPANSVEKVEAIVGQRFLPAASLHASASAASTINVGGWGYDVYGEFG